MGDINNDGYDDLVVGAPGETSTYTRMNNGTLEEFTRNTGAIYVIFMDDKTGIAKDTVRIAGNVNGGPTLYDNEYFGYSVANIGDLNGDGIADVAVGAPGTLISSVYVIYLGTDGKAIGHSLIRGYYRGTTPAEIQNGSYVFNSSYVPTGPDHVYNCRMGTTVASIGDWDKDGVPDIAVTSLRASGGSVIYFFYMSRDGTVKSHTNISSAGRHLGRRPRHGGQIVRFFWKLHPIVPRLRWR